MHEIHKFFEVMKICTTFVEIMRIHNIIITAALTAALSLASCGGSKGGSTAEAAEVRKAVEVPTFSADSAYAYVQRQVDFGPRNPGSAGHAATAAWLGTTLRSLGADTVIEQRTNVRAATGETLAITNFMARYNADAPARVLLLAHWDTRPWADEDPDPANHRKPVPGANDGASGVGVLLELARLMQSQKPSIGIDLLFVDAEDCGLTGANDDESWCLGTQYWLTDMPYRPGAMPRYAVLLDMVGGDGARFYREGFSTAYASPVVDRVWQAARKAGYGEVFVDRSGSPVTDDHYFLLRAGFNAIDIIEANNASTGSFPPYWHTLADDMTNISTSTLQAVGQTMAYLIYNEQP